VIVPKFAYNPGTGVIDFIPSFPAVNKTPFGPRIATRHDSTTTSGLRQSVLERIDIMKILDFVTVPESDMSNWDAFFSYALGGGQFTYYPDSTDDLIYIDYSLEDVEWKPKRIAPGFYSFSMTMRLWVGTATYFS
jgi:hypothetical protein